MLRYERDTAILAACVRRVIVSANWANELVRVRAMPITTVCRGFVARRRAARLRLLRWRHDSGLMAHGAATMLQSVLRRYAAQSPIRHAIDRPRHGAARSIGLGMVPHDRSA